MPIRCSWLLSAALALLPAAASAWSEAAQDLAKHAQAEFSDRLVIVSTLEQARQRKLPGDARRQFQDAEQTLFRRAVFKGVIAPFRHHWFDEVRCAIYVPADAGNPGAELWTLAHEIGHCVARLNGWQESLWTDPDVVVRHRIESWADAFATLAVPAAEQSQLAAMAMRQRANLGGDAAYMTDRAIRCGLLAPAPRARALTGIGQQVERILQSSCLTDAASLRATEGFLSSLK